MLDEILDSVIESVKAVMRAKLDVLQLNDTDAWVEAGAPLGVLFLVVDSSRAFNGRTLNTLSRAANAAPSTMIARTMIDETESKKPYEIAVSWVYSVRRESTEIWSSCPHREVPCVSSRYCFSP